MPIYAERTNMNTKDLINVAELLPTNEGDLSGALQRIIDENPNKTLFFPDGSYHIAHPIKTSAHPERSVSLLLSDFAVIKATDDWDSDEALLCLGGAEHFNTIEKVGSNYGVRGGVFDGSGRARGISIDSGRESYVVSVSIKNTSVGLHIKWGANSGSADADIKLVNIVGNGFADSIGVLLEGHDNTLQNMRIANVHTGVLLKSGGNILRDIHPLYRYVGELGTQENYESSVAFDDRWNDNFYEVCYSDQFCTGFSMGEGTHIYNDCFIMWYSDRGGIERAFNATGKFRSVIRSPKINFRESTKNSLLTVGAEGGEGYIENPIADPTRIGDDSYKSYLSGRVIHSTR